MKNHSGFGFVSHNPQQPTPIASFSTVSSLLTLFLKFFSSFLHSTCSLSDSHRYLALDEVYHPIRAAFPSYSTLRTYLWVSGLQNTGVSPSLPMYCKTPYASVHRGSGPSAYNAAEAASQLELFRVRSPLLTESLLISFPPLTDMLKFRGWSGLISGGNMIKD